MLGLIAAMAGLIAAGVSEDPTSPPAVGEAASIRQQLGQIVVRPPEPSEPPSPQAAFLAMVDANCSLTDANAFVDCALAVDPDGGNLQALIDRMLNDRAFVQGLNAPMDNRRTALDSDPLAVAAVQVWSLERAETAAVARFELERMVSPARAPSPGGSQRSGLLRALERAQPSVADGSSAPTSASSPDRWRQDLVGVVALRYLARRAEAVLAKFDAAGAPASTDDVLALRAQVNELNARLAAAETALRAAAATPQ